MQRHDLVAYHCLSGATVDIAEQLKRASDGRRALLRALEGDDRAALATALDRMRTLYMDSARARMDAYQCRSGPLGYAPVPKVAKVYFNHWPEPSAHASYTALEARPTLRRFYEILDVSDLSYFDDRGREPSGPEFVRDLNAALKSKEKRAVYNLYVVRDPAFFEADPSKLELEIDLVRVRKILQAQEHGMAPRQIHRLGEGEPLSFGRVAIPLKARRDGRTELLVSIWDKDWATPLGTVVLPISIGGGTTGDAVAAPRSRGLLTPGPPPKPTDFALHLLELPEGRPLHALFRDGKVFADWRLGAGGDLDLSALHKLLQDLVAQQPFARTLEDVVKLGKALQRALFPEPAAAALRALAERAAGAGARPSLYARLVVDHSGLPSLSPLGILPIGDSHQLERDLLGFAYRLELPLDERYEGAIDRCVKSWSIRLPTEAEGSDPEMGDARKAVGTDEAQSAFRRWLGAGGARAHGTMKQLLDAQRATEGPRGLVLLSHQAAGRMFYGLDPNASRESIGAFDLGDVPAPSIAVLLGCETASAATQGLVRELNQRGHAAVIATTSRMKGKALGQFLGCFAAEARAGNATIGEAYDRALACFGKQAGPQALGVVLLGNRDVRLCKN